MNAEISESTFEMYRKLIDLAQNLETQGLGDISAMTKESLIMNMQTSKDLPKAHAEEGRKFTAMAYRIAPPSLVATFLKHMGEEREGIIKLPSGSLRALLQSLGEITDPSQEGLSDESRGKGAEFKYKPSETIAYIERCKQDPSLQLSMNYYSIALQMFVRTLLDAMSSKTKGPDMMNFGVQFDSKNLVSVIPIALNIALERRHGDAAPTEKTMWIPCAVP